MHIHDLLMLNNLPLVCRCKSQVSVRLKIFFFWFRWFCAERLVHFSPTNSNRAENLRKVDFVSWISDQEIFLFLFIDQTEFVKLKKTSTISCHCSSPCQIVINHQQLYRHLQRFPRPQSTQLSVPMLLTAVVHQHLDDDIDIIFLSC